MPTLFKGLLEDFIFLSADGGIGTDCGVWEIRRDRMLSIIIPAYNEKQNIERTAKTLSGILEKAEIPFELLFISDGSTDGTYESSVCFLEKCSIKKESNVCQ